AEEGEVVGARALAEGDGLVSGPLVGGLGLPPRGEDGELTVRTREGGLEAELLTERGDAIAQNRMVDQDAVRASKSASCCRDAVIEGLRGGLELVPGRLGYTGHRLDVITIRVRRPRRAKVRVARDGRQGAVDRSPR